jgi:hypothetical protein
MTTSAHQYPVSEIGTDHANAIETQTEQQYPQVTKRETKFNILFS